MNASFLIRLAWRNLWRNKLRSILVIASITLGIWAGVFVMAFSFGMNNQRSQDAILTRLSHLQISTSAFVDNHGSADSLSQTKAWEKQILALPEVAGFSSRTVFNGLIASAKNTQGVQLIGVNPEQEPNVTNLASKIDTGEYLNPSMRMPVLIGKKLAEQLRVKVRSKLVLSFQAPDGQIVSSAFRVCGIFKSGNTTFDEQNIFVTQTDLQTLSGTKAVHEIAILLKDPKNLNITQEKLQNFSPKATVRTWKQVAPDLGFADEIMAQSLYIFVSIILLALLFGMVNTMLMAVLERKRELGMLMALGLNKRRVFSMVVIESCYTALLGGPLGLAAAYYSVKAAARQGLDLSIFGEGLEALGMSSIVYPQLDAIFYYNIAAMVLMTSILAALYPAQKALKLNPIEAIRSI